MFSVFKSKSLRSLFLVVFILVNTQKANGQKSELSADFHKNRRVELRQKLPNNSVAVFFSSPIRNRSNDTDYVYHPDPNFFYLTGWNEPHAVLLVYNVPQEDEEGLYYEKLYVRERDARNEMWNVFVKESHTFDRFDTVLIFDFKNDVRDNKSDSSDLFDLQQKFKSAINYPENFDPQRYRLYQRIRTAEAEQIPNIKRMISYYSTQDETLLEDPIIKDFLLLSDISFAFFLAQYSENK